MMRLSKTWLIVGLLGGVIVSLLIVNGSSERKKWAIAWAREVRLRAQPPEVLETWRQLQARYPDDHEIHVNLVEAFLTAGQPAEAEQHWQVLLSVESLSPELRSQLSGSLQVAGRHQEAYDQVQRAMQDRERELREAKERGKGTGRMSTGERVSWVNRLAYSAYLADRDLESRWRELSLVLLQNSLVDQFALYRSQAWRIVGRSREARQVVEGTLRDLEQRLKFEEQGLERLVGIWLSQPQWPPETEPELLRFKRNNLLEMRLMLRLLYEQASSIGQDLGDVELGQGYQDLARAIHGNPDGFSLDMSAPAIARQLVSLATYLDTRGSLATKLQRWREAQADLDASIEAMYLARAISVETGLVNSPNVVDRRVIRDLEQELDQMLAAFHYHRGLLAEAQGRAEETQRDHAAIRRLGFEPGPELH